ncbi:MAG: lipoprotein LpqH [Mycobacterium sp.]
MLREVVIGVGGAAIVVAGVVGCSSKKADDKASTGMSSGSGAMTASSGSVTASAGAGTAKVSIDGQPKDVQGQVVCAAAGGNFNIAIGDPTGGLAVVMSEDASKVNSVGLGNINGVALGYQEGVPGGAASATKDGKTYKITGTATGVDMANPMQPTTKPFEIEVTCP